MQPIFHGNGRVHEQRDCAKNYQDITPAKWHSLQAAIIEEQGLKREYSNLYEKEYVRRDGTVFPVELSTYLARDDHDRPACLWAVVRDISLQKQAQEKLQLQTERLHMLSENAPFGMAIFAEDGAFEIF
jgi:two-component system, cell cycle sensor histidine kinase and response regulator CckA